MQFALWWNFRKEFRLCIMRCGGTEAKIKAIKIFRWIVFQIQKTLMKVSSWLINRLGSKSSPIWSQVGFGGKVKHTQKNLIWWVCPCWTENVWEMAAPLSIQFFRFLMGYFIKIKQTWNEQCVKFLVWV